MTTPAQGAREDCSPQDHSAGRVTLREVDPEKSPASARLSSGGAECQWGMRGLLLANALTSSLLPLCLPGLDSLDSQMTRAPRVQTLGMASRHGAVGRGGK